MRTTPRTVGARPLARTPVVTAARVASVLLIVPVHGCSPTPLRWSGNDGHTALACMDCHVGEVGEAGRASVPEHTCGRGACHDGDAEGVVRLGAVGLTHEGHGGDGVDLGCVACHAHREGTYALEPRLGTCSLCHMNEMSGARSEDCRACHGVLEHRGETSQGVSVDHGALPWIEDRCVRCHYDVSPPTRAVDPGRCFGCHARPPGREAYDEIHLGHAGFTCTACHEPDAHRIREMSSSVDLVCADCHALPHAVAAPWRGQERACGGCHTGAHADQQRMVLGLGFEDVAPVPSEKFLSGLTCRSCHAPVEAQRSSAGRTDAAACTACHPEEYGRVLTWWRNGVALRVRSARAFAAGVGRMTGPVSSPELARATALLDFVERGRGVHNLALTHRLVQRAVGLTAGVSATLGPRAPSAPSLGLAPDTNACARCHYDLRFDVSRPGTEMSDRFHREVTTR